MKTKKKKSKKRIISDILMVICILVALGSGGYLAYYYYTSSQSENAVEDLKGMIVDVDDKENYVIEKDPETGEERYVPEMVTVNGVEIQKKFQSLYEKNNDFIGWITIEDTHVDYPVMYTPNDGEGGEYYIHRNFEKEYSSAGIPFIDRHCMIKNPTDNIIIYGHNMNSGTMFHDIIKYQEEEFYNDHKTFTFDTIYGDGTYEVVAMFYGEILAKDSTQFKYYTFVDAGSEEAFMNYVNNVKRMSIIDTGVEVEYGDQLVTLSTCAYHVKNGRFAVIAKKIVDK